MAKKNNMPPMNQEKKVIPHNDIDHKTIILDKQKVKERNEATTDYTKQLNATGGRGFGNMYVGNQASNRKEIVKRIWGYLGRYKVGLVIVAIALFLTSLLSIMVPFLFGLTVDELANFNYETARTYAIYIFLIAFLYALISYVSKYVMVDLSQKTVAKIRQDAFDKLQDLPVKYYDQNQPGDISSRITNDLELISNSLNQVITQLITSVITLLGSAVMMFVVNWVLAIIVLLFVPIMGFITAKIGGKTRSGFIAQQKHLGGLNSIVEESISGLRVLKLYSQEKQVVDEFKRKNKQVRESGFKANVAAGVIMPIIGFLNNLIYVVLIIVGASLMLFTRLAVSIGDIASITTYARNFIRPIQNLAQLFNTLQRGLAGAERVFSLIDETTEYEEDGSKTVEALKGDVVFKDVTFGYNPEEPVLKNITFTAEEGKTIAIVGPTGSGKTTIINLLNRFYDIDKGDILIDNESIYKYQKDPLRKKIGVVLQDTNLFAGTVYENILYGNLNATKEEVEQAATLANAHDFIVRLPKGYQSPVQEKGQNFSQGERQLISIARTILSNPDILILDEATSNVDTRTEYRIQKSMNTLMKGRTSFVIAHRLQTIRNAHRILVIKDGELIENGSHKELLSKKGFYYDLYKAQFKNID